MKKQLLIPFFILFCFCPSFAQISLVKSFADNAKPTVFEVLNNQILFNASGGLWKSDGTTAGTTLLTASATLDGNSKVKRCKVGNILYFWSSSAPELWKTDGTSAGTVLVKSFATGNGRYSLVNVNGLLIFTNNMGTGKELWRSDGTDAGTYMIVDLNGTNDGVAADLEPTAVLDGYLYFQGPQAAGELNPPLYRTDGTAANTTRIANSGLAPRGMITIGNKLIYSAYYPHTYMCQGQSINDSPRAIVQIENGVASLLYAPPVINVCGGLGNTFLNSFKFIKTANYLYFIGLEESSNGGNYNLWRMDGTTNGTVKLTTFSNSTPGSTVETSNSIWDYNSLTDYGFTNLIYFPVRTSTAGLELWRSDGTASGTFLVKDINPGSADSNPREFQALNGICYFFANDGTSGIELWKSDGTASGTQLVQDLNPTGDQLISNYNSTFNGISLGNTYYFSGTTGSQNGLYSTCTSTLPIVSVSPSSTICLGSNATITASGCTGTINWSTGATTSSITVSPTISSTYTATCSESGCATSAAASISITVNPVPGIQSSSASFCVGSISFTATGVTSGLQWQLNGTNISGAISTTYTPTQPGAYRVVSTATQCASTSITVYAIPALPAITASPSTTFCQGQSVQLAVANCTGTLTWAPTGSGNTITISPTQSTAYTATCSQNSCLNTNSINLTVKPAPLPPTIGIQQCANAPTKRWDKRFGGTETDYPRTIITLPDGGFLIGASTYSGLSGDKTQASQGDRDYWLVRLDSTGVKLWDKRFGGVGDDDITPVITTADGGFLLGGSSTSDISGDRTQASRGGFDYWILKVDASGNKLWDKRFGGPGNDYIGNLLATSDGGYLLIGNSDSNLGGDKTQASQGLSDMWILKVDASGNKLWDKRWGGTDNDYAGRSLLLANDEFMVVGTSASGLNGDKSQASQGGSDYWLVKFSASGDKVWDKRYGGTADEFAFGLSTTPDGGYLLAGWSASGQNGDKSQASQGGQDYWVLKVDASGSKLWDKRYGGTANETLHSVLATLDGGYLLAGWSASGAGADKSEASQGQDDYWLVKIDGSGVKLWDKRYGGSGIDQTINGNMLTMGLDGRYVVAGSSDSPLSGDRSQAQWGGGDSWLIKFGDCYLASSTSTCPSNPLTLLALGCAGTVTWSTGATGASLTVTPGQSTTYSATCTQNGCTSSASNTFTLTTSNTTSPTVNPISICSGTTASLTASGCSGGTINWYAVATGGSSLSTSTNFTTPVLTTTTNYYVSCTLSGCESNRAAATVTVRSVPAAPGLSASPAATLCQGANVTLTASGCAGGTVNWSTGASGGTLVVSPISSITYTATCTQNGCAAGAAASLGITVVPQPTAPLVKAFNCTTNQVQKVWDKRFGGANDENLASLIATTDGGYLLGGSSTSGQSGDKSEPAQGATGSNDFWVVKIDGSGSKLWDKRFGGTGDEYIQSLIATADGGYLLGGYSNSGQSGDKSQSSQGGYDMWVVKIDGNGTKLWDKRFGGSGDENLTSLIATTDGGYLLGGYSNSGQSGDKSQSSQGGYDMWVVKIDGNGTKLWDKRFGGSGVDHLYSLILASDGGYLLGGTSTSGQNGDKSQSSQGSNDMWIVKVDVNGTKLWDKRFGGTDVDSISSLIATVDGGYLLGGLSGSGQNGDKSQPSQGDVDYWVVKIDWSGSKLWDKRFGGTGSDVILSLIAIVDGGYLLGGYSYSGQNGDKSQLSQGGDDYWVVKIDGNGTKLWDKRFGGSGSDIMNSLTATSDGSYLLGGTSASGQDGDKSQPSQGSNTNDMWVVKITECTEITGTLCAGTTVTLQATGCTGTVTWSTGATGASIKVTPQQSTTYTATCTLNGCISPASNVATVAITSSMYTIKTGNWNDPTVWSCGRVPVSTDTVTLNHSVTLLGSYTGLTRQVIYNTGGQLLFSTGGQLKVAVN